jgi:hypothetical protein
VADIRANFSKGSSFTDNQDFPTSENVKGGGCAMAGIHRFSKFKAAVGLSGRRGFPFLLHVGASWQYFEDLARSRISNHSPQPERAKA